MRTFLADGEPSAAFGARVSEFDFDDQPGITLLYAVTGRLMEMAGPMFWAALAVLFIRAELIGG
jgi:hypothetical protein